MLKAHREQNYFIAHPKTASTSATSALTRRNWEQLGKRHAIEPYPDLPTVNIISVIRHPMDYFVSWFCYQHRQPGSKSAEFAYWLEKFYNRYQIGGLHFYGFPLSTHVIFFHELQRGWDAVMEDIGHDTFEMPRENGSWDREPDITFYYNDRGMEIFLRRFGDFLAWYNNVLALKGNEPFLRRGHRES